MNVLLEWHTVILRKLAFKFCTEYTIDLQRIEKQIDNLLSRLRDLAKEKNKIKVEVS